MDVIIHSAVIVFFISVVNVIHSAVKLAGSVIVYLAVNAIVHSAVNATAQYAVSAIITLAMSWRALK